MTDELYSLLYIIETFVSIGFKVSLLTLIYIGGKKWLRRL